MPTELLTSFNATPDNLSTPSILDDTTPTTITPTILEDTASSDSPIQRLCSLYAHNLSDFGNARNFVAQFGHQVRYVPTLGWLLYTGTHWQLDTTNRILTLAHTSLQSYSQTAQALTIVPFWSHAILLAVEERKTAAYGRIYQYCQ